MELRKPFHHIYVTLFALLLMGLVLPLSGGTVAQQTRVAPQLELSLELIASGFVQPTDIAFDPVEGAAFVTEKEGRIQRIEDGGPAPFLDITDRVSNDFWERGLLGLVFHPDYAGNRYLYVHYTDLSGDSQISRFEANGENTAADPATEHTIMSVSQPSPQHQGGDLLFGPDGYLYIPLGDGAWQNDPHGNAQNPELPLGKLLRIDVDGGDPYTIPPTNPFVDDPGTLDEIWAFGLRNPWRASFDSETGELYMSDVGWRTWEEVNVQPAGVGGQNYGWSCFEGTHENLATHFPDCQPPEYYAMPVAEYSQHDPSDGFHCAVVGGYVYRGGRFPTMYGRYLLLDHCSGNFWDLVSDGAGDWILTRHDYLSEYGFGSFGEDYQGELYVANWNTGNIYHLVDLSLPDWQYFLKLPIILNEEAVAPAASPNNKAYLLPFSSTE